MHVVEPKIQLIAETGIDFDGISEFLHGIGAEGWSTSEYVSDGEFLVEVAGRTCYKSFGTELNRNLTRVRADHREYIGNILATHHGSVLEHATTTIGFIDVSRIFTHELVRHRPGAAYSQESMRFVRMDDIGMYIPDCIEQNPNARDIFITAVRAAEEAYAALVRELITDDMPFSKKKEITSAIRRIAPGGHSTTIVTTGNHRAWRHQIALRTAEGAEEEIVKVFMQVAELFIGRYPAFYQDMESAPHEGKPHLLHYFFQNEKV